jgi:hypothetical protein
MAGDMQARRCHKGVEEEDADDDGAVREWFVTEGRVPAKEMVQSVLGLVVPLRMASAALVAVHA